MGRPRKRRRDSQDGNPLEEHIVLDPLLQPNLDMIHDTISTHIPAEVELSEFDFDGWNIRVAGTAPTRLTPSSLSK